MEIVSVFLPLNACGTKFTIFKKPILHFDALNLLHF